jgi:hypothetical protein
VLVFHFIGYFNEVGATGVALLTFGASFFVCHTRFVLQRRCLRFREAFLRDTLGFSAAGRRGVVKRIFALLATGRVRAARLMLDLVYPGRDKEYYKLACRINYYLGDYGRAISAASSYLNRPGRPQPSATLLSLSALSMSHFGLTRQARELLENGIRE